MSRSVPVATRVLLCPSTKPVPISPKMPRGAPGSRSAAQEAGVDVLAQLFASMPLLQRHRAAPLVCRRWAKAAATPAVIAHVNVCLSGPRALQRAEAFGVWLSAHGGGIRQLEVELAPDRSPGLHAARSAMTRLLLGVHACHGLAHCALTLRRMPSFHLPPTMVVALRGLQSLMLRAPDCRLTVHTSLAPMAALRRLSLSAHPLRFQPGAGLPTQLTGLNLGGLGTGGLPQQVSQLRWLEHLQVEWPQFGGQGWRPLAGLGPALKHLDILSDNMVATLTRQRSLHLVSTAAAGGADAAGALLAALPRLEQLHLSEEAALPAGALSGMASLRRLCWEAPAEGEAARPAQLPGGGWLASLERLQAPAEAVLGCLDRLAGGAPHLEVLALQLNMQRPQHGQLLHRLRGAALPALKRLVLHVTPMNFVEAAVEEARRLHPALEVEAVLSHDQLPSAVLVTEEEAED